MIEVLTDTLPSVCASLTEAMVHCICTCDTQLWDIVFVTILPTVPPLLSMLTRGGTSSGVSESTPAGFCVFLSDPDPVPE